MTLSSAVRNVAACSSIEMHVEKRGHCRDQTSEAIIEHANWIVVTLGRERSPTEIWAMARRRPRGLRPSPHVHLGLPILPCRKWLALATCRLPVA